MSIKFSQVVSRGDKIKMTVLLVVAVIAWVIVWQEYKKPTGVNWQAELDVRARPTEVR